MKHATCILMIALLAALVAAAWAASAAQAAAPTFAEASAFALRASPDKSAGRPNGDGQTGGQAEQPGGGDERVVTDARAHDFEPWRLPKNYRNPDGSFNQAALVEQQKKRLDVMNKRLVAKFKLVETPHYLVFSDAQQPVTDLFAKWAEALYANLCKQFAVGPSDRIWDGKCILVISNTRATFLAQAATFDGFNAGHAGAYFAIEAAEPDMPRLVHICVPLDTRDPRRLQELFAHEGTHAFFQLYKKPVDLPLWLHEGLAEFMVVVNDKDLRGEKQVYAKRYAQRGTPIEGILVRETGQGLEYPEYSVAYTLVDFLVAAGKDKFKKFVDELKDGKDQETALKDAYGWTLIDLERRWRVYVGQVLSREN